MSANPRILVVDDDDLLRSSLRRLLQRARFEAATASSAEEALGFLSHTPVPLVISDFNMPGMGGLELLAEVRRRWPHTVRVVLSGEFDPKLLTAIANGEVHHILAKPWENATLVALVTKVLLPTHAAGTA